MVEQDEEIVTTEGKYFKLFASIRILGDDLTISVWGGDKAHVGAVAVAQPRASLNSPDQISSDASVICLPGHKEDQMARMIALKVSKATNRIVVVTAGAHWDQIDADGIQAVLDNGRKLTDLIIDRVKLSSPPQD